jgi:hypothetical protein
VDTENRCCDRLADALGSPEFNERTLRVTLRVGQVDETHLLEVTRTTCHFGGSRPWFRCPACSERAAVLFRLQHGLVCRKCGAVAYRSQSLDVTDRSWKTQRALERKLAPDGSRPARMHRATYLRIESRIAACERRRLDDLAAWLIRLRARG